MLQTRLNTIIKELAEKYEKHPSIIEAVLRSQLNCANETITQLDVFNEKSWKNIRFKHLGTLKYNSSQLLKIKEKIECKNRRNTTEESESTNK